MCPQIVIPFVSLSNWTSVHKLRGSVSGTECSSIQNNTECQNLFSFLEDSAESFEIRAKMYEFITDIARL